MTAKQKAAREKFKAVVKEAAKLRKKNPKLTQAQAVKQAWAISYSKAGKSKKVGAIKIVEKGESKKAKPKATYQQKRTAKGTFKGLKKIGAASSKVKAKKGKSTEMHTDTKSHNVNIRVMSGIGEIGKKFKTLTEVKNFHISKGGHWFDRDTMKYFRTKIHTKLIGGKYFIYSNQIPYENRIYKIAEATNEGNIFPITSAPRFENINDAKKYLANKILK